MVRQKAIQRSTLGLQMDTYQRRSDRKRKIKNKYVDFICNNDAPSKYPLFVPVDFNTWTQTRYRLETFKEKKTTYCAVEVNKNSPIYYEAIRNGINSPMTGILVAKKMNFKRSKYSYYFNRIQPKKPEFYRA